MWAMRGRDDDRGPVGCREDSMSRCFLVLVVAPIIGMVKEWRRRRKKRKSWVKKAGFDRVLLLVEEGSSLPLLLPILLRL